jgi:hypothetical protein
MDWREMAKREDGLNTLEGFSRDMNIQKSTAVLYLHELRKRGFVKTLRGRRGGRLYDISPVSLRKTGSEGFYEVLNENSTLKIQEPFVHRVYGRNMRIEEVIVEAIKTRDSRTILSSLALFRKVKDWSGLYELAKKQGLERHTGALYSLSRRLFRVKSIDGRILRRMKEAPVKDKFMIPKLRSDDFKDIEEEWGVHIPFNKSDIGKLKPSFQK